MSKRLNAIGLKARDRFKELNPTVILTKRRVDLKTKKKKEPFHWWVLEYPESFIPEIDAIIKAEIDFARSKRKRKRKTVFSTDKRKR
ncbi:MAG TPA: hypothetical protein VMU29_12110 [Smithella sp.]|nr:hypothetical protein [Smithella sp.]